MIQVVTDPNKIVTDKLVLKRLAELNIDKNYVELFQDYAPRSLGKEHSPYAKFYRDLKSNKRFAVFSELPMVKPDGKKIEVGWLRRGEGFESKANLFSAIVKGKQVTLTVLSDQPTGEKKDDQVIYQPQLLVDVSELICREQSTLLPVDPINSNYKENTLEWSYGTVCKRRIRLIEGRFRERWIFGSNPHSTVKIKHNSTGNLKLKLGYGLDAEGMPLKVNIIGDEEIIEASEFDKAAYPVEIGASQTFYPDADPETTSVDGSVTEFQTNGVTWATIRAAAGTDQNDSCAEPYSPHIQHGSAGGDKWRYLRRFILVFPPASIPDDATFTGATLSLYAYGKNDDKGIAPATNIYSSASASTTELVPGDFNSLGSVAYCDSPVPYADWPSTTPGYQDWVLNAIGVAALSKTDVGRFGARFATYDVDGTIPDYSDGVTENCYVLSYAAEQGSGYKPKLVVTYETFTPYGVRDTWIGAAGQNQGYGVACDGTYIYAVNCCYDDPSAKVIKINPADMSTVAVWTGIANVENRGLDIVYHDGYLYILTQSNPGKAIKIDASTMTTADSWTDPDGGAAIPAGITTDGTYIYIGRERNSVGARDGKVYKIRMSDMTTIDTWTGSTPGKAAWALTYDGTYLYVGDQAEPAKVYKIDTSTMTTIGTWTGAAGQNISMELVNDGTYLYAGLLTIPGKVVKIAISSMTTSETWTAAAGQNYVVHSGMLFLNGYVYANIGVNPTLTKCIDSSDMSTVETRRSVYGQAGPYGICYDGTYLYVGFFISPAQVVQMSLFPEINREITGNLPAQLVAGAYI